MLASFNTVHITGGLQCSIIFYKFAKKNRGKRSVYPRRISPCSLDFMVPSSEHTSQLKLLAVASACARVTLNKGPCFQFYPPLPSLSTSVNKLTQPTLKNTRHLQ